MTRLLTDLAEGLAEVEGITATVIPDLSPLAPFLISLVSDGDHWCYLSTSGALTAGRRDADNALLPYETDDRLHDAAGIAGPVTALRIAGPDGPVLWEPFGRCPDPRARRAVAKSLLGDVVWLEEVHPDLPLALRCRWATSDAYGLIRRVELVTTGTGPLDVEVVDGVVGLVPHGVSARIEQTLRNLSTAYRRSDVLDGVLPMAVHTLEARIVDQAVPAESLRATVTWSIPPPTTDGPVDLGVDRTLHDAAVTAVRDDPPVRGVAGQRGAHLIRADVRVRPGAPVVWHHVADVAVDHVGLAALRAELQKLEDPAAAVEESITAGSAALEAILATADGVQRTGDPIASAHHLSNTLFNCMRGGVFADGGRVDTADLRRFLPQRNRDVADRHAVWLDTLPPQLERDEVVARAQSTGDRHLHRLVLEHLPIRFSRRHGDPSRPWNRFSIRLRDPQGEPTLGFEGNWRDIFQNWEALCQSFPAFLPGVIATFVNASTADGFNPYRVTREGIDWEVPDPEDPWSNIGYWGDHQIVYLLRLLEAADRWLPGTIDAFLTEPLFTYADVPYRLKSYEAILADPRQTIVFDAVADKAARARAQGLGGDGLLVAGPDGQPRQVTLVEKLLVPALTKLSAFVPDGGIWMHTQRPEWNDANNALVGNGLSMVTLFHLRRYLRWLADLPARLPDGGPVQLSSGVARWLLAVTAALRAHADLAGSPADPGQRAGLMRELGEAFEAHRTALALDGPGDPEPVASTAISELVDAALPLLDGTIARARRADGLFHSYNLLHLGEDGRRAEVTHLEEMLEGQVAVLSAGVLDPRDSADLLAALADSTLHRPDQDSYVLYPDRRPPAFVDKNVVPAEVVDADPLLRALRDADRTDLLARDAGGIHRFGGDLANADDLSRALDLLARDDRWATLVTAHRQSALDAWETVFHHHAFTGRSGSMYAYEGLGSIYWHMVGKLLLAVQEQVVDAHLGAADPAAVRSLSEAYDRVRQGLGFTKRAATFGAFPTDAYSHSPAHAGAQQPGMTGYVKELLLARLGELGVWVREGCLVVDPVLLDRRELLTGSASWSVRDVHGRESTRDLVAGQLGLTVCQVPLVITVHDHPGGAVGHIEVDLHDGTVDRIDGLRLDRHTTRRIAMRTGEVERLRVEVPRALLPEPSS